MTLLENFKKQRGRKYLYIDAKVDSLIARYKETRRDIHLLKRFLRTASVAAAVKEEQRLLVPVKTLADYSIDTRFMSIKWLRERIICFENSSNSIMLILCLLDLSTVSA